MRLLISLSLLASFSYRKECMNFIIWNCFVNCDTRTHTHTFTYSIQLNPIQHIEIEMHFILNFGEINLFSYKMQYAITWNVTICTGCKICHLSMEKKNKMIPRNHFIHAFRHSGAYSFLYFVLWHETYSIIIIISCRNFTPTNYELSV